MNHDWNVNINIRRRKTILWLIKVIYIHSVIHTLEWKGEKKPKTKKKKKNSQPRFILICLVISLAEILSHSYVILTQNLMHDTSRIFFFFLNREISIFFSFVFFYKLCVTFNNVMLINVCVCVLMSTAHCTELNIIIQEKEQNELSQYIYNYL